MSHNDDKEGALSGDQMHYDNDAEEYKDIAVTDPDYRDKNEKLVRANIVSASRMAIGAKNTENIINLQLKYSRWLEVIHGKYFYNRI